MKRSSLVLMIVVAVIATLTTHVWLGVDMDIFAPVTAESVPALTKQQADLGQVVDSLNKESGEPFGLQTPLQMDLSLLRYCVAQALTAEEVAEGRIVEPATCFSTQEEAAESIADTSGTDLALLLLAMDGVVLNTPIIGTDYDGESYSGSYLYWTANSTGCFNGQTYFAPNYPSNWSNRVSSAKASSGCNQFKHFDLVNYSGGMILCTCAQMWAMGNATSSATWGP